MRTMKEYYPTHPQLFDKQPDDGPECGIKIDSAFIASLPNKIRNKYLKAYILTRIHQKLLTLLSISSFFLLTGCASIKAELQEIDYPKDTAILIGDSAYQINTVKCAKIKAIGEDGTLDCYDFDGIKSASITPVSDWRRNYLKENLGIKWASPEHQAFLFNYFHGGGKEKTANAILKAYGAIAAAKKLTDSLEKSKEIETQAAKMKIKGIEAYATGGMPAWHAHKFKTTQWHLENSRYFSNQLNNINLIKLD